MTKQAAKRILRMYSYEDDIYKLIEQTNGHLLLGALMEPDEFRSIIEAISDGNYTIEISKSQDKWGRYKADIVDNRYYQEYWS